MDGMSLVKKKKMFERKGADKHFCRKPMWVVWWSLSWHLAPPLSLQLSHPSLFPAPTQHSRQQASAWPLTSMLPAHHHHAAPQPVMSLLYHASEAESLSSFLFFSFIFTCSRQIIGANLICQLAARRHPHRPSLLLTAFIAFWAGPDPDLAAAASLLGRP